MTRTAPRYGQTVRVGDHRVEASYMLFVADQLRRHHHRKALLRDLEESVIRATPRDDCTGMPKGAGGSDPIHQAAVRLMDPEEPTFAARAHLRASLNAIQEVYNHLPVEQQRIIEELYWRRTKTLLGVAQSLNMTTSTVCRKRNQALLAFAIVIIGEHILLPLE